ncbi:deoxyribose-phosphate aldolase [Halanaerobacter jeridensis]|uniref:Deoxyribose-phosphate aldolase n=1 Tax=Halanaerobacter jeridensis TaxID=706427 RepID=A0A939BMS4_9FIRM|nr:deoxyribose-phosphate aldolase [Halanaerobacter jeridensis]MBM7557300.1 deoxyribose-phosphate aldolase [Halanaerobacter jeridensis]
MEGSEVAVLIDHTILSPDITKKDVEIKCQEAKEYNFASVCVNPSYVEFVADQLKGSNVKTCTVIGFPLGESTSETKSFAAKNAVKNGADEVDMVINIGAVKSAAWDVVEADIKSVVKAVNRNTLVKVILETCYLDDNEIKQACKAAQSAGADFVKTSTGFGTHGARVEDVELMKESVDEEMGIKASGGIHSLEEAVEMLDAGATRIGASSGVEIVEGVEPEGDGDY